MGKEMSLVKSSPIIALAFLAGCGNDASISANTDKEPEMFLETLMGNKPKQTYVIASPMAGTLMQNGEPLAYAKIIRHLWWTGNESGVVEEFSTDAQGRFHLPVHEEQLIIGKLTQFACSTHLEVELDDGHKDFWYNNKFEEAIYAETAGRYLNDLMCDISNEEMSVRPNISSITTICRWQDMPPEREY
jgi:hypothetical protein